MEETERNFVWDVGFVEGIGLRQLMIFDYLALVCSIFYQIMCKIEII